MANLAIMPAEYVISNHITDLPRGEFDYYLSSSLGINDRREIFIDPGAIGLTGTALPNKHFVKISKQEDGTLTLDLRGTVFRWCFHSPVPDHFLPISRIVS